VPDPKFPQGIVSSIYYDTRNWTYLSEKRNSDYLKTKVRLRWYESTAERGDRTDVAFAEAKFRVGSRRMKVRSPIAYRGDDLATLDLRDRELLKIPSVLRAKGEPIKHTLLPTFMVRYHRRRYIDRARQLRISLDFTIMVPKVNRLMLSHVYPALLKHTVLEIKGSDGQVPLNLQGLFKLGFRRESFSKYFECYGRLTRTTF